MDNFFTDDCLEFYGKMVNQQKTRELLYHMSLKIPRWGEFDKEHKKPHNPIFKWMTNECINHFNRLKIARVNKL